MFWFILLLLIIGAGFYFYSSMKEVDDEIKESHLHSPPGKVEPDDPVTPDVVVVVEPEVEIGDEPVAGALETEILRLVTTTPGMKQTDLYPHLADVNRKTVQQTVKELADAGRLCREKSGSSYLLYP